MPTIYDQSSHTIDRSLLDKDALHVIHRLREAGYSAYLVGGGVRDLLLGKSPKDYDISTSARPEQVKRVFGRKCLLIGRRFRLAHIRFGHHILEVSTFRAGEMTEELIVHDNEWGNEEEDVRRRDFTINGLLYDPESHSIIDYVGGWEDIQNKMLRSIGEPEVRFKQDPVRMIRLLKFQARYGFSIHDKDQAALASCLPEIKKSSPARLLEEWLRMLESKASAPFVELMLNHRFLELLFPKIAGELQGPFGPTIKRFLEACDHENKSASSYPLERPVLVAALLYPILEDCVRREYKAQNRMPHQGDILEMTYNLMRDIMLSSFSHFPKRIQAIAAYILTTQFRFVPLITKKQHPVRMFRLREFPLALRLLKLRSMVYPQLKETYLAWREHYKSYLDHVEHRHTPHATPAKRHKTREPMHG
jgi:poly(A) polymerase